MQKIIYAFYIVFLFDFASAKNTSAQDSVISATKEEASPQKTIKYGIASYYAKKFNGRVTATGDTFRSTKLTAACNILPLETWVKVTNVRNNRSIIVFINDRMHHRNKRLIDLSRLGAQKLRFVTRGITRVKVEVIPKPVYK